MFQKTLFIPIFLFLLTSCTLPFSIPKTETVVVQSFTGTIEEGVEHIQTGQTREEKLGESKRRINFRSIIRKGDYFSLKSDQETALKYYLNAYLRLKEDNVIERKIAGVYFDLKDFENAHKYYIKVPFVDLEDDEKKKMLSALMFDESTPVKSTEIQKLGLSKDETDYYSYIETCYTGIHNCIINLDSYSGSYESIGKLKNIIDTYMKVSSDFHYRNILIAGAFFESKEYLAGAKIAEEIIEKRPDYKIAYKIAGYCNYELGKYKEANTYLSKYYAFDTKDITTMYTLGLTNYYLEDYMTSNMYFNAAVLNGYMPKTELERRLVYNYYMLDDKKGMLKVFRYLLKEEDVNENDFIIAVHMTTDANEWSKGFLWANEGLEKFKDSDMLYALRGNLYLLNNNMDIAADDFSKAYTINPRNPVVTLGFAKWHFAKNNYTSAKEYIQSTKELDPNGVFEEQADELLKEIESMEANQMTGSGVLYDASESVQ
ncbi:MAG: tetratricopeptide repeat protein [Candidatus Gracilibacteria bacterium]|nr:tetratricopeptide repeat protein [Candidatus Gracilibacteria bacterium]